jgi:tetratricopeptide (TPR) repeat protein
MTSVTDVGHDVASLVEDLERSATRYREAERAIDEVGADRIRRVANACEAATKLLDSYDSRATGSGREEFKHYLEFEGKFTTFVEDLPEDLPRRDAFEDALEAVDKRRVTEGDFERARTALSPAVDLADRLDERERTRSAYFDARRAVEDRLETVDTRVEELERVLELGEADLDAPTERLRDPVETYDEGVREAFREFKSDAPAQEVLGFIADTQRYPLVGYDAPPADLLSYVRDSSAGEESVTTLVEYAEYSPSKLGHYVENPRELKRRVATERTYLERLDAGPLTVGWPPPPADRLDYLARELVGACSRFAPESVVADARRVRALSRSAEYDRLREAAVAADRLDEETRRRLAEGEVKRDLDLVREARARLEDALEEYPAGSPEG